MEGTPWKNIFCGIDTNPPIKKPDKNTSAPWPENWSPIADIIIWFLRATPPCAGLLSTSV